MAVKNGDKVKVEYEGKLNDGTIFDSSEKHGAPLEFEVGSKKVIKGFEEAIIGMKKGEEKEFKLKPADAYGDPNPDLIKKVPKEAMPQGKEVKAGMMLIMTLPNGVQVPAQIKEVGDKDVTIDLNHPLAGKELNFKVKLVGITESA
ncbi:peptidylprolyl isomerase [Candidatus Woesearchaeota archaeon]|nr:MAG: peptidylprolyl isomerase [Candidatus Woesearchaeota archaeon]